MQFFYWESQDFQVEVTSTTILSWLPQFQQPLQYLVLGIRTWHFMPLRALSHEGEQELVAKY